MAIKLDIEVGDVVLTGKFKNKRTVVKEIGTDELGQPTINGKPILKLRIEKLLPKEKQSKETREALEEMSDFSDERFKKLAGLIKESANTLSEDREMAAKDLPLDAVVGMNPDGSGPGDMPVKLISAAASNAARGLAIFHYIPVGENKPQKWRGDINTVFPLLEQVKMRVADEDGEDLYKEAHRLLVELDDIMDNLLASEPERKHSRLQEVRQTLRKMGRRLDFTKRLSAFHMDV